MAKKSWSCWFQTADSDIDVLYGANDLQLAELLNRLHSSGIPFRMGEDQGIQHINFSEGAYDITVVKTMDFYVRRTEIEQEEERMQILYCRTADLLHSRLDMRNSYHYLDMRNSVAEAFLRLKTAFRRKPKSKLLAEVFLAGLACTSLGDRVCQPDEIFEASVAFCHFYFSNFGSLTLESRGNLMYPCRLDASSPPPFWFFNYCLQSIMVPYDEGIAESWLQEFQSMDFDSPEGDSTNEGQGESTNEGNEESTMDESLVDVVAGQVFREAQDGEARDIADETSVSGSESASDDIAQLETLSHGSAQVVEDDTEEAVGTDHSAQEETVPYNTDEAIDEIGNDEIGVDYADYVMTSILDLVIPPVASIFGMNTLEEINATPSWLQ